MHSFGSAERFIGAFTPYFVCERMCVCDETRMWLMSFFNITPNKSQTSGFSATVLSFKCRYVYFYFYSLSCFFPFISLLLTSSKSPKSKSNDFIRSYINICGVIKLQRFEFFCFWAAFCCCYFPLNWVWFSICVFLVSSLPFPLYFFSYCPYNFFLLFEFHFIYIFLYFFFLHSYVHIFRHWLFYLILVSF